MNSNIKLRYNHIGYGVGAHKIFFVASSDKSARLDDYRFIIRNISKEIVFEDFLKIRETCDYTDEVLYEGDFSCLHESGTFDILVLAPDESVCLKSHVFEISDEWLLRQLKANIKSFYFQRSGVELPEVFAGKWARPAAHLDDQLAFHPSMNRDGFINAHGGWYDAGDYGKYIVNGGVSVATLMFACEIEKSCRNEKSGKLNAVVNGENFKESFEQPVSLIDEIRFELEFFLRMQDEDGGAFFKVTPMHWDGFVSPFNSDILQKRFILGKSTTSTLNLSAALAQAHRVFTNVGDDLFASECLNASVRAYEWALENPNAGWPHNTEGSGAYGDECYDDEFFWARAMLFREVASVEAKNPTNLNCDVLRMQLLQDMEKNPPKFGVDWRDTQNLGWFALALESSGCRDDALVTMARKALESIADQILQLQKKDAYAISIRKFIWGSNGEIANHALTLAVAYSWTKRQEYLDGAYELLHFIYGRNPVDVSFVTGSAWSAPMFPHHRISHSDEIEEPVPGLVVGGINSDRQDLHRMPHYPGKLPGFSYTDERCSFASNETAINWNAPLTALLCLLNLFL